MTLTEMLEANSIPEPNSGCWLWLRGVSDARNPRSYPVWRWQGRKRQVTHLVLEAQGVEVPKGMQACHRCDVTLCVHDGHLFVGTPTENMQDASRKGRLDYGKKEVCANGHPMSGDNLYINPSGRRRCRACNRDGHARRKHGNA